MWPTAGVDVGRNDVDDAGAARNVSGDAEADTVDGVRPLLHRPRYDGFCDG